MKKVTFYLFFFLYCLLWHVQIRKSPVSGRWYGKIILIGTGGWIQSVGQRFHVGEVIGIGT